jgi:hypothetical protein
MPINNHQDIVQRVAKAVLVPAGLVHKGRSRFWYDDRSWFATCVEFQPSSFSRGAALNVGINWLWEPKDHWSFDFGYRVLGFAQYIDDATWESKVSQMACLALDNVVQIRTTVGSPADAYSIMAQEQQVEQSWQSYHMGIAAGLSGRSDVAQRLLGGAILADDRELWVRERNKSATLLLESLHNLEVFTRQIEERIATARKLLKLPPLSLSAFQLIGR